MVKYTATNKSTVITPNLSVTLKNYSRYYSIYFPFPGMQLKYNMLLHAYHNI